MATERKRRPEEQKKRGLSWGREALRVTGMKGEMEDKSGVEGGAETATARGEGTA